MATFQHPRDFYRERRVLVTGGASFIGSHLVELLVECGARVTVADDFSSGKPENLDSVAKAIQLQRGDLRVPAFARAVSQTQEVVFHLAAAHGGRGYIETHPVECMNNMLLDHVVFAEAARAQVEKIVFASSACVYPTSLQASDSQRLLLKEADCNFEEAGKAFADGEYGWAKLMGEMQLHAFRKQHGLSGIACRIFTAYGERENESHAVIALIAKAAARMDPYPIWGNGLQTRNFTYVRDTVQGMALAGAQLEGFQVLNLGTDTHHTILELVEEVCGAMGWRPHEIRRELDKPVGVKSRAADVGHCQELLGWVPTVSLREGIRNTVQWYLETQGGITGPTLEERLMERWAREAR